MRPTVEVVNGLQPATRTVLNTDSLSARSTVAAATNVTGQRH